MQSPSWEGSYTLGDESLAPIRETPDEALGAMAAEWRGFLLFPLLYLRNCISRRARSVRKSSIDRHLRA